MAEHNDLSAVHELLTSQRSAVLATRDEEGPYTSLMVIQPAEDLASILLATPRATRKYDNMTSRPEVALLVDDRSNRGADVQAARALTILGRAEEVLGPDRRELAEVFARARPELAAFLSVPDTALIRVRVRRYILVERFQESTVFEMGGFGPKDP